MNIIEHVRQIYRSSNFRNSILYTLFAFINNGISFILILILAKYISPNGYGELNLFNTLITILTIIICLSTNSYIPNTFFRQSHIYLIEVISICILITIVMLCLLSSILIIFSTQAQTIIGIPIEFIWIALLICVCQAINNINLDIWRLEEKPICYGIYSLSNVILNFILTLILIFYYELGWEGRPYAQFSISLIYLIISILFLIKREYIRFKLPSLNVVRDTLIFGLPLVPHAASYWLKQGVDRYIINYYWDATEVGLYSFALNLASIINVIGMAFNANNSVHIYKSLSSGISRSIKSLERISKIMIIVFFTVSLFIATSCFIGMPIYFPEYTTGIIYIFPLCIGAFFQCLYLLYVNYLFYFKKTRQLMYITFSTALLQIGLSIYFTKLHILYTSLISMSVMILTFAAVYLYSKKILREEICNEI